MEFTAIALAAVLLIIFVIVALIVLKYLRDKSVKETEDSIGLVNESKLTSVNSEDRNSNVKKQQNK